MKKILYLAPMEGSTGYIYRNIFNKHFPGTDKFFTPFISANHSYKFRRREKKEVLKENNIGMEVCPQVLTKEPEHFLWAADEFEKMGYRQINLNLGCPSGTVTAKGKGSGMLREPERLEEFLGNIFSNAKIKISIKTRLGYKRPEEFEALLKIFNRYPISELIVHPRVREDFYKGGVREEWFGYAYSNSKNPLVYNGDIATASDYETITKKYPNLKAVMIGRGVIGNPALISQIKGGGALSMPKLRAFMEDMYHTYEEEYGSGNNAINRMKDIWSYFGRSFQEYEKEVKKIQKTKRMEDYERRVEELWERKKE